MEPLVSVIMPNWNSSPYTTEAIESILNQTYRNLELIIVDSHSTDGSLEVAQSFERLDPRVKIIFCPKSTQGAAMNAGIEAARGDYIARMDADDVSEKTRFEKEIEAFRRNPKAVLVYSDAWRTNSDSEYSGSAYGHRMGRLFPESQGELTTLLRWCFLTSGTILVKQDVMKKYHYDPKLKRAEDWDFLVRLALDHKFAKVPEQLYGYRMHQKQQSAVKHIPDELYHMTRLQLRWLVNYGLTGAEKRRLFMTILLHCFGSPILALLRPTG